MENQNQMLVQNLNQKILNLQEQLEQVNSEKQRMI